jgi:hypothetical protein
MIAEKDFPSKVIGFSVFDETPTSDDAGHPPHLILPEGRPWHAIKDRDKRLAKITTSSEV